MPLAVSSLRAHSRNTSMSYNASFLLMLCASQCPAAVIAEGAVPLLVEAHKNKMQYSPSVARSALGYLGFFESGEKVPYLRRKNSLLPSAKVGRKALQKRGLLCPPPLAQHKQLHWCSRRGKQAHCMQAWH